MKAVFTLAQISDPHLGPLPVVRWRELASKRVFGYVNWHRRRGDALGPGNLQLLVEDVHAASPDHIAVTGDLINIGLGAEIDLATKWLSQLGPPHDVSVIPGNHDAYLPGAVRHFERAWHAYMTSDNDGHRPVTFPYVRRRGPVAVVGVSTAIATAPLMATGRIRPAQADRLRTALSRLAGEGLFRVVLIHHPPALRAAGWHRRLIGASIFRRALKAAGAELILHGHNHRTSVDRIDGPSGPIPVIGAASASLHPHAGRPGGSYLSFRIDRSGAGFGCTMVERGPRRDGGGVETLSERRLIDSVQLTGTRTHA